MRSRGSISSCPRDRLRSKRRRLTIRRRGVLCTFSMENEKYKAAFRAYLERLRSGERDASAWSATVGEVGTGGAEELEADYRASLVPHEVTTLRTKYTPPSSAPEAQRIRPLEDAEVHILWARLRIWGTPEARRLAAEDLDEAARTSRNPELAMVRAYFAAAGGERESAKTVLREAVSAHPEDPRLWTALGRLTLQAMPRTTTMHDAMETLAPIIAKLVLIAESPAQLDFLAETSLFDGKPEAALAYEKRAIAVDPNCIECLGGAARAMLRKGMAKEALEVATLAQGISPEGDRPPWLESLIAQARARSAAKEQTGAATSEGR